MNTLSVLTPMVLMLQKSMHADALTTLLLVCCHTSQKNQRELLPAALHPACRLAVVLCTQSTQVQQDSSPVTCDQQLPPLVLLNVLTCLSREAAWMCCSE